jgi:hypothetical protein
MRIDYVQTCHLPKGLPRVFETFPLATVLDRTAIRRLALDQFDNGDGISP